MIKNKTHAKAKSGTRSKPKKAVPKKKSRSKKQPTVYKCKQCLGWISVLKKAEHFCIVPTEQTVISILKDEELMEAWLKFRSFAAELGEQRIYASAKAIMFSRSVCYMFARPKKTKIEVCFFLPKKLSHPNLKSTKVYSSKKYAHTFFIQHEDQVEGVVVDWIKMAWDSNR